MYIYFTTEKGKIFLCSLITLVLLFQHFYYPIRVSQRLALFLIFRITHRKGILKPEKLQSFW